MKTLLLTGGLLLPQLALATSVIFGCASYHFDRETDFNERNGCLGIEYEGFTLLAYDNSEYNRSYLVGFRGMPLVLSENLKAGLLVGAVTGYQNYELAPVLSPTVAYSFKALSAEVSFVPAKHSSLTFNLRYSW